MVVRGRGGGGEVGGWGLTEVEYKDMTIMDAEEEKKLQKQIYFCSSCFFVPQRKITDCFNRVRINIGMLTEVLLVFTACVLWTEKAAELSLSMSTNTYMIVC